MKPHEAKNRDKTRVEKMGNKKVGGKRRAIKKTK
jgi:hypothetical protein